MARPSSALGAALMHDSDVIDNACIEPSGIAQCLAEMVQNINGSGEAGIWHRFTKPGEGECAQYDDSGQVQIVLEFRNTDVGTTVCAQLYQLREQFRAITSISGRSHSHSFSVVLIISEPV